MTEEDTTKRDEIQSRLRSTQKQNEVLFTMIERTKKMIKRARMERALLLEKLDQTARPAAADDMDSSPPGSPEPHLAPQAPPLPERADSAPPAKRAGGNKLPNAYTMFCEQERDELVRSLEEAGQFLKPTAIQSKLSEMWKALSKEEKKPFAERARELKRKDKAGADESEDEAGAVKEETEEPPESAAGSVPGDGDWESSDVGSEMPSEAA